MMDMRTHKVVAGTRDAKNVADDGEPIVVGLGMEGKEDGSMWRSRLEIKLQK